MDDFSLYVLDITMNSVRAGATEIEISLTEDENGMLTFTVTDNGAGMEQEKADRLTREALEKNYGIFSVNKRLKTYYGAQSGLVITSAPDQGCTVRVRIFLGRGVTIWSE